MTSPDAPINPPIPARRCPACDAAAFEPLFRHRDWMAEVDAKEFTIVRCAGCGVVSYEPFPDAATLRGYYPPDYYAHAADSRSADTGAAEKANSWRDAARRRLDDIHLGLRRDPLLFVLCLPLLWYKEAYSYARFLRPLRPGRGIALPGAEPSRAPRLLDVGCGDGAFLRKARRMGFECWGLEPGGQPASNPENAGINFFSTGLEELAGHEEFFDVITLNHVFEHLPDPIEALRRLRALLAPRGRLLIRMPRTDQFLFRRWPRAWFPLETPRHVYLYDPRNFTLLATRCGWRIETIEPESNPTCLQLTMKAALFGRPPGARHWIDLPAVSFALLPVCSLLRRLGQADWMALWLRRDVD